MDEETLGNQTEKTENELIENYNELFDAMTKEPEAGEEPEPAGPAAEQPEAAPEASESEPEMTEDAAPAAAEERFPEPGPSPIVRSVPEITYTGEGAEIRFTLTNAGDAGYEDCFELWAIEKNSDGDRRACERCAVRKTFLAPGEVRKIVLRVAADSIRRPDAYGREDVQALEKYFFTVRQV